MKIEKINKKKNNQYQVILSDNTSLSFYDDTIIKFNLLSKKEFDKKKLEEIIAYNSNLDAYYSALKFIKTKLRTKKEIEEKLKKLGYKKEVIEKTIKKLENQKYLNDEIYIKSYIADQVNLSLKGPNKIIYELEKLGFKKEIIDEYLEEYSEELWEERVKKIIQKRIKTNHNYSKVFLQNKLRGELNNLGYDNKLINSNIANMDYQDSKDILIKEIMKAKKKYSKKYQGRELEFKIKNYLYSKGFNIDVNINDYMD